MDQKEVVQIYKALAADSRLKILQLIKDKQLCVNAITRQLSISQSAVSQHLAILKKAGLVKSDRYGSIVHYAMRGERLEDFKKSVRKVLGDEFILLK